ncbi:Rab3 GTPase-activating protein catalytic subunit-domain-containing protein [Gamsiella multidivaricata]|uniref:Rab3 GTPase-activating protein catalytic subunit-domain-containing protein n=1 Tax=Gamsiella multidivaricata TaxID=101098 RepID=UPI002220F883|nr:Rab3 GTPase-activating protein catalytic subunit-domain-containing protein [Gamsiella multidivaricata]KAG0370057.1 Rab3 GTPase-activating protein catalytic subunit [Gamsiella multidivaricata]KAI7830214.1 Rab3 GTPase-activating protein catalytic subunit-domain-containing protein [Gamsiella multidivaricata]
MDDFENFEFIDYTTSGPWERFITQIEDSLRSWGLVDRNLGVFDPATITATEAAKAAAQSGEPAHGANGNEPTDRGQENHIRVDSNSPDDGSSATKAYQLREMLSLDDATYALTYHYHPAKARAAAGVERIDMDFLPTLLEGVQHHSLHRWTSLTHILIISPVTISDIFASTISSSSATSAIIDLSSAKLLLSSFAIAFQNTGCNIPVFVPTGQPWNLTFMGLMIQPRTPVPSPASGASGSDHDFEDDESQGHEVRFNTTLVPYPPVQYTDLSGIMNFFIERMGLEGQDLNSSENLSQSSKEQIFATALFSYDLVNWYDEDWRRWKQAGDGGTGGARRTDGDADTTFQMNNEPTMNTPDASMNMDDIKAEGGVFSTLPFPILPFGPVQDPLQSLRLFARFDTAPSNIYLDSKGTADMDATHANTWILQAAFKEDDYGILSDILEDAIASWSSETANKRKIRRSGKDQTYESLLNKGARLIQGTVTMVDTVDVENILDALLGSFTTQTPNPSALAPEERSERCIRLTPASELGLHFKHATTVPYNSFLWRMTQYLLDVISPNSEISYATSIMGFMKVLWSELLKQFYTRWENSELIPMVDIYGEGYAGVPNSARDSSYDRNKKPVAIDLRFSLLHQKLSMLNCCIARQISRNKEAPEDVYPLPKRRREMSKELARDSTLPQNASTGPEPVYGGRTAQLQSLLHGLSDISRPRSADVVPMAKRFLETVKNRGITPQQGATASLSTASTTSPSAGDPTSHAVSRTEPSSPTAAMPIPKMETFRRRRSSSRHTTEQLIGGSDDDEDEVFYDSMETNGSVASPYDMLRRGHSLTESFVALKYSSSADSQSEVLVNDLDQSSVDLSGPDPREVADESKSEGGVMPLKNLKLLKTGAPLLIPKLQEPGYMTEDMIQVQEELFETLGSSSDGAKMRAKMQSTQLISDMEAFKAANPGCVLGDFIRWHSPKDWAEDKGEMSARMADAGNYWQELWAHAKRVPVSRQTPLFNYNREAAKVLFYLEGISPDQLFLQLLPTMCLIAYDTLVSHPITLHIRQVAQSLDELSRELKRFAWNELTGDQNLNLEVITEKFRETELLMGRAIALVRKFPEQYGLVERILEVQEAVVEDGVERECVNDLFSIGGSLQSSFPQPTSREFVLEAYDPVNTSQAASPSVLSLWYARPLQRRMYAGFKESEVRIVETVAKDSLYM